MCVGHLQDTQEQNYAETELPVERHLEAPKDRLRQYQDSHVRDDVECARSDAGGVRRRTAFCPYRFERPAFQENI